MKFTKTTTIILIAVIAGAGITGATLGIFYLINVSSQNALENADVDVDSLEILSVNNNTVEIRLIGTITNPSGISATLHPMTLSVEYLNNEIGITQTTTININGVSTEINQTVSVNITNSTQFMYFMDDFLKNSTINLEVSGLASITAVGISINKPVTKNIAITGMNNQFNLTVINFGIINANSTHITANITTEIKNPSSIKITLTNVYFDVFWQNQSLGELLIQNLIINTGNNNECVVGIVKLDNLTHFDKMVDNLLNNTDITLNIKGKTSENNVLSLYISRLDLNVLMPGLDAFDCIILAINLTDCSNNSFSMNVLLEIYNPTSGPVSIYNITFNTTYNGEQLGLVSFPDLTVNSGTETYLVAVNFTLTNDTLLSEILTNYLSGIDVNITFIGVANGSNVISNMVDGYEKNVTLPASINFNYGIGTINLVNSSAKTLTFNTTLIVNNPTPLTVYLNATLNVTYKVSWIGNLTADSITLIPGTNNIPVQIIISGEKNMSAVEELLSQHINGNTVELILNGTINLQVDGMKNAINTSFNTKVNFDGNQDQLITQIRLNFIVLNVNWASYPTITYSMNAYVNATVFNPFNFSINITYLEYDIYFDDNDGCLIQAYIFLFGTVTIANYPQKSNINIDNITKNYTASPPEIKLNGNSYQNISETISSSDPELCSRLYDEYYQDDDLVIDIKNGKMQVQIGDFSVWVSFEFLDVPVPNTT
ncbi:MAG: DUF3712 domain-containing protein [Candidatus Helarchaeota archaeon]